MSDHFQSLGDFLRHEREKRSITIEQVASATKISVRLLHSLEADQYGDMPAKPFIRGFVNSYCRFIGLDSKEILTRFDSFIDRKAAERPSRDAGHSGYAFEKREGEQSRTMLWVVMGVFGVLGAVLILVLKPSLKHHKRARLEELKAAHSGASPVPLAAAEGGKAPAPASVPSPVPSATATPSPAGVALPEVNAPAPHGPQSAALLGPVLLPPWSGQPAAPVPAAEPSASPKPSPKPSASPKPSPKPSASPKPSPKPSASPKPSPKPSASPKPSPKPSASPKPSPKPSPSAKPTAQSSGVPVGEKPDPLNSGVNLTVAQIKYKVLVKAVDDVWVRYQVDGRPSMKFPLRKDRVLVLRAATEVRLQVSKPDSVTFSLNGAGSKPMSQVKGLSVRQGGATLILSAQNIEKTQDPFPGERNLPAETPPSRGGASSNPPVTP